MPLFTRRRRQKGVFLRRWLQGLLELKSIWNQLPLGDDYSLQDSLGMKDSRGIDSRLPGVLNRPSPTPTPLLSLRSRSFVPGHFLFSLSSFSPAKIAAEFLHGRNQGMRVDGKPKCSALRNRKMRTVAYGRRRWRRRQRRRLRGRWPVKLRPRAYTLWPCCLAHSFVKRKFTCIDRLVLFLLVELGASIV